ncbi:oligosaccharide flippase family protein [Rhodopseudomonas palustris]|nr:oligosaccharide flippase family protein [Rhodopseudomonas palustris]
MLTATLGRAGWVAAGTLLGQGAVLVATPFLARIFTPADFGQLAILITISNIATAVACLRYDLALPAAPDSDINGLLRDCIASSALLAACAAVAVDIVARVPGFGTSKVALGPASWTVVLVCVFAAGVYQAANALLLRWSAYRGVALIRASQGVLFALVSFVRSIGLMWAHALSFLVGGLAVVHALRSREGDAGWLHTARAYAKYPIWGIPGAALDVVGYSLCVWTIAGVYGDAAAGEYSQVQRLVGAPLMLVSISLGQILLRQTAELQHDKAQLRALLGKVFALLAGLSVCGLVALFFVGEPGIALILGGQWSISRDFIVCTSFAAFVRACVSPLSSVLITFRRFELALAWQATYFVSAIVLFSYFARTLTLEQFVAFYAIHECVLYGAYAALIARSLRR